MIVRYDNVKYVINNAILDIYRDTYCKDIYDRIADENKTRLKILKRDLLFLHRISKMKEREFNGN